MEWLERDPLPDVCKMCKKGDCYNCEHTGTRWYLSPKDELLNRKKMMIKAIERLQKQVDAIDRELALMEDIPK